MITALILTVVISAGLFMLVLLAVFVKAFSKKAKEEGFKVSDGLDQRDLDALAKAMSQAEEEARLAERIARLEKALQCLRNQAAKRQM